MTRKGPAPKPTSLKRIEGNPGHRPLSTDEPTPPPAALTPPGYLDGDALECWSRMSRELHTLGLFTTLDVESLAAYCVQFARWKKAEAKVKENGEVVKTTDGNAIQNPYLSIANRALKEMGRLAAEFGFSPAARVRLHSQPVDDSSDLEKSLFGDNVKVKNNR